MRHVVSPLFALLSASVSLSFSLLVAGCASETAKGDGATRPVNRRGILSEDSNFDASPGARSMRVQNEMGVYESSEIEETLAEHMDEIRACYPRAGRAQRYAGGQVMLRFMVSAEGKPEDVLVIATDLGNYDVERCLVDVARRVRFPPPHGHKATTFEYPFEFKSTREMQVQDLDGSLKIAHDVTSLMHSLSFCGAVTESGASAIFYVEPNGAVASVGLASESVLDEQAGACLVRAMRRWRMSATLPGRMLRCRTNIPAFIASAEPLSRRAALSGVGHKRRR